MGGGDKWSVVLTERKNCWKLEKTQVRKRNIEIQKVADLFLCEKLGETSQCFGGRGGGGGGEYQLSVGVVFTIASCSILTPASSINNTRFRCKNCMISWFVFLGGVIYARLGNARAWDFLEEDVFPKIPHPLCSNFYASSSLSLSLVSNWMNYEYIINCISCIWCITCSYYLR